MYKQDIKAQTINLKTSPHTGNKKHSRGPKAQPDPSRTKTRGQARVYSERKKKTHVESQDTASMLPPIRVFHRRFTSSEPQQAPETYRDQNHHQRKHQFQIIPLHLCVPSVGEHQSPIEISSPTLCHKPRTKEIYPDLKHQPTESFKSSSDEISSVTSHHHIHETEPSTK